MTLLNEFPYIFVLRNVFIVPCLEESGDCFTGRQDLDL